MERPEKQRWKKKLRKNGDNQEKQKKLRRRRRDRNHAQITSDVQNNCSIMEDIERQLALQRQQRQQKQKDAGTRKSQDQEHSTENTPTRSPKKSKLRFPSAGASISKKGSVCSIRNHLPSSSSVFFLTQTDPFLRRRQLMRSAWGAKVLARSVALTASSQNLQGDTLVDDIACKVDRHPSCHTFDVTTSFNTIWISTMASYGGLNGMAFQSNVKPGSGFMLQQGQENVDILSVRQGCLLGSAVLGFLDQKSTFQLMRINQSSATVAFKQVLTRRKKLTCSCFAMCDSKIYFPQNQFGKPEMTVISCHDGGEYAMNCSGTWPTQRLSDIFCVEAQEAPQRTRLAFGHRDGSLSIWDTSTNRVCQSANAQQKSSCEEFGSVTDIVWLSTAQQILARGSFGDIHLYDIRCMSLPVKTLSLPSSFQGARSKISRYCNGIAIDPSGNLAIAPLLTHDEHPCVGFWSLHDGWIGEKHLASSGASLHARPPFFELCKTTTPVSRINEEGAIVADQTRKKRFGLWFKSANPVRTNEDVAESALRVNNIYQMHLAGSSFDRL